MRKTKTPVTMGLTKVFAIPALVFGITLAGLLAALLVQGWPDAPAAIAVGSGLFVLGMFLVKRWRNLSD